MKLVARSGEDHDTQGTTVIQTIDIRAAEAGHSQERTPVAMEAAKYAEPQCFLREEYLDIHDVKLVDCFVLAFM